MSEKITYGWIEQRIKKCIDQHFKESRHITDMEWLKVQRLHYIGGVLQTALHLLPTDRYFELKRYCKEKHGYNPGGLDGQLTFEIWEKEKNG